MLHTISGTYKELARLVPGLQGRPSLAVRNKQKLFEIARKKMPRPSQKTPLGTALNRYANRGLSCYDPVFAMKIRRAAPHWFVPRSETARKKKNQLLKMAGRGKKRPSRTHPLGQPLSDYTNAKSSSYDPDFTRKIKRIAPSWFVSKQDIRKQTKRKLLEMANNGEEKPVRGSNLVGCLYKLTNKNDPSYDPLFDRKIRNLAPHWFASKSQPKKKLLLKMARGNKPKPKAGDHLYGAFIRYTRKDSHSYDPDFASTIKKLRPDWFLSSSDINKNLLIDLARNKMPIPNRKTKLRQALVNYIRKTSLVYDPHFTKNIKKLAPHWFKKCSTR